jgi:hypothetical protein
MNSLIQPLEYIRSLPIEVVVLIWIAALALVKGYRTLSRQQLRRVALARFHITPKGKQAIDKDEIA